MRPLLQLDNTRPHLPSFSSIFLLPRLPLWSSIPPPDSSSSSSPTIHIHSARSSTNTTSTTPLSFIKPHVERTTRYLREADRRAILQRIRDGEKQADLAKEYQVSRAAISNLKHRRRRSGQDGGGDGHHHHHRSHSDPAAVAAAPVVWMHRDVGASARFNEPRRVDSPTPSSTSSTRADGERVVDILTTPVMQRLLDQIEQQHQQTPSPILVQRLIRLLLEETLGRLASGSRSFHGVSATRPSIAFTIDSSSSNQRVLRELQVMEPLWTVGRLRRGIDGRVAVKLDTPASLAKSQVLLLHFFCSTRGDELIEAVRALVHSGVDPWAITVVAVAGVDAGLARVRHEVARVFTARMIRANEHHVLRRLTE